MSTTEEIQQMLHDIEQRESRLNDWERKFVDDVSKWFASNGYLSERQDEKLTSIWERVTA